MKASAKLLRAFFLAAVFGAVFVFPEKASAIDVSVQRIILEGKQHSATVTVKNDSDREQVFVLDWIHYRMGETRGLENIPKNLKLEGVRWADGLIRFEPARFVLPRGGSRQVRLSLQLPPDTAPGEYRTHLWIRTVTPPAEGAKTTNAVVMQTAMAIPVFVRQGKATIDTRITDLGMVQEKGGVKLHLTLKRSGNRSVFGDLEFACVAGGKNVILKTAGGIAVYAEVAQRKFGFHIDVPDKLQEACRSVRVDYRSLPADQLFSGRVMASASVGTGG